MNKIVIYSGGFQPFGLHHYNSYLHLCEQFGKDNVLVATSDFVTDDRPLSFSEKQMFAEKYGINLVKVKSPYKCSEITENYDSTNTQLIMAVGMKDGTRLFGKYYKPFNENISSSFNTNGFVYIIPHTSIKKLGKELSGTNIRELLSKSTPQQFKEVMGWYDKDLHELAKTKFKSQQVISATPELLSLNETRITKTQLQRIEQYADRFFKQFGIDVNFQDIYKGTHFYQRLNDPRNGSPITQDELRSIFRKASIKHGYKLSQMNNGAEGVLKDMESDINIPFMLIWDKENQEIDLVPKTIMRKPDFKTKSPVFAFEDNLFESLVKYISPNRHIPHLYEDNLTHQQIINIINEICDGNVELFEKVDGQNLSITYRNGQCGASRNKSTLVTPMNKEQLSSKFDSSISTIFCSAFDDINNATSQLSDIFEKHNLFLNFEILHPDNQNVFYYGEQPLIVLHNLISYTPDGQYVGEFPDIITHLYNYIKERNLDKQSVYKIIPPNKLIPNPEKLKQLKGQINKIIDYNDPEHEIGVLGYHFLNTIDSGVLSTTPKISLDEKYQAAISKKYDQIKQLKVLDNIYKLNKINTKLPTFEGVVFKYNDRQYKLTGSFRYLNQILGATKYK